MPDENRSFSYILIGLISLLCLSGCQLDRARTRYNTNPDADSTLVDPKYSLSKDRQEFEKIREEIPEAKRRANDEKALIAEWMSGYRLNPQDIRERYNNLVRKKRDSFNKDMTRLREDVSKAEKKNREVFLKELEEERSDFSRRKRDREERSDFFNQIDQKRKDYFAEEREKRDEFEAEVRDKRKNFEDYLKEKSLDFNSELRIYSESWKAQQKSRE